MSLVRIYHWEPEEKWVNGVRIYDPKGRKRRALSIGLCGRSLQARGMKPLDKDYGVFDLKDNEIRQAKACGWEVVPA